MKYVSIIIAIVFSSIFSFNALATGQNYVDFTGNATVTFELGSMIIDCDNDPDVCCCTILFEEESTTITIYLAPSPITGEQQEQTTTVSSSTGITVTRNGTAIASYNQGNNN